MYQATKIETRYRLSDYGQWFVDPVLYFEARKEWIEDKPLALEGKLILAKDVGPVNVSVNGLYEVEFIPAGGGREHELGYALGTSYELTPWVRLGGEVFGSWTRAAEDGAWASQHYAGPAVSLAVGRTWLVLAAGFGLAAGASAASFYFRGTAAGSVTLTASPTSVASGTASTLTWSSTNATSCTASVQMRSSTPRRRFSGVR